jgi:hypothetical protein
MQMRRWSWGLAAAGLLAGAALAQPAPSPTPAPTQPPAAPRAGPPPGGYTQLFMSPCGEPWRAGRTDPYPSALWFTATDTNHDGAIDKAEFRADFLGFFDALDRDGNGLLEGAEITYYEQRVAPDVLVGRPLGAIAGPSLAANLWGGELIAAQVGGYGGSSVYTPEGAHGPAPDLGGSRRPREPQTGAPAYGFFGDAEPVMATDTNLDGRVSRAEFQEAADRRFKRLDHNADGKITPDELPKTRAQVEGLGSNRGRG